MTYSRWQKRREPASHIDDWLMTYADMITLLLCFFAIFLTVSMPQKNSPQKAQITRPIEEIVKPKDNILEGNLPLYGRTQADRPTDRIADQSIDRRPADAIVTVPVAKIIEDKPRELPPVIARAPTVPEPPAPQPKDNTPAVTETIDKPTATLSEIVNRLKAQGPATIEQKGDRITTFEANSAAFFASGSATLSDAGKAVLRDVAFNIKSDKFRDYQVTVEGHTDDAPIKTPQFPSNWELSTARAAAVVHFFLEQGIPAQRLRAAGYADTFPKAPNHDDAGNPIPANQAQNRRVVIKLEKIDKTER